MSERHSLCKLAPTKFEPGHGSCQRTSMLKNAVSKVIQQLQIIRCLGEHEQRDVVGTSLSESDEMKRVLSGRGNSKSMATVREDSDEDDDDYSRTCSTESELWSSSERSDRPRFSRGASACSLNSMCSPALSASNLCKLNKKLAPIPSKRKTKRMESMKSVTSVKSDQSRMSVASTATYNTLINCDRTSAAEISLTELEAVGEEMPVQPWCGKCQPLRPTEVLPMNPQDVNTTATARKRALEKVEQFAKQGTLAKQVSNWQGGGSYAETRWSRTSLPVHKASVEQTAVEQEAPLKKTTKMKQLQRDSVITMIDIDMGFRFEAMKAEGPERSVAEAIGDMEKLKLDESFGTSVYSRKQVVDHFDRPVLNRLTQWELGQLELWAMNHVKQQYVTLCARAHVFLPKKARRLEQAMQSSTLCQLLRAQNKGKHLQKDQQEFVHEFVSKLPFFEKIPNVLFDAIVGHVDIRSYVMGSVLFMQGTEVDGVHILVQGDVELRSEDAQSLVLNKRLDSPAVVLENDLLDFDIKLPWNLKPKQKRFWSRTAAAPLDDDDGSVTTTIFIPVRFVEMISEHQRQLEQKELETLVTEEFAPTLRIKPAQCQEHMGIFEIVAPHKGTMLYREGTKPDPRDTHVALIIEGEVAIARGKRKASLKRTRMEDTVMQRGQLLGYEAVLQEPFKATIFAKEDVKLLRVNAQAYIDKLLTLHGPLDRHRRALIPGLPQSDNVLEGNASTILGNQAVTLALTEPKETGSSEDDDDDDNNVDICVSVGGNYGDKNDAQALLSPYRKRMHYKMDRAALLATTDWKLLIKKEDLPRRRPVKTCERKGAPQQWSDLDGTFRRTDLCYPKECELFPKVLRNTLAENKEKESSRAGSRPRTGSRPCSSHASSATQPIDSPLAPSALLRRIEEQKRSAATVQSWRSKDIRMVVRSARA